MIYIALGMAKMGKSHRLRERLRELDLETGERWPVFIHDPRGWHSEERAAARMATGRWHSTDQLLAGGVDERGQLVHRVNCFTRCSAMSVANFVWYRWGCARNGRGIPAIVVFDEGDKLPSNLRQATEETGAHCLANYARTVPIHVLMTARSPKRLSADWRLNATEIDCFLMQESTTKAWLRDLSIPRETVARIEQLQRHQFVTIRC